MDSHLTVLCVLQIVNETLRTTNQQTQKQQASFLPAQGACGGADVSLRLERKL